QQKAKGAIAVVLDARTGDVLAMANKPDYSTRDFSSVPAGLRKCRAITDSYEPGSTFKIVLAAAALDSGKVTMGEQFFCGNSIVIDGWTVHNADDGASSAAGSETLKEIITWSFNVGTSSVALKMGKRTYFDYICKFGFGEVTGIALPGETEGIVQPFNDWANITLATNSFGQGITVTPLQLASACQAIANKGVMMKPRLVKEILSADGKVVRSIPPAVRRRVVSEATSYQMREILRNVVEKGTGKKAEVAGFPVAGKTGTAQVVEGGGYAGGRYVASFVGYAPAHDPRIVAIVKVEEPGAGVIWGGAVAAPVFHAIAKETMWRLGVQPVMLHATKTDAGEE
ncbi:MAG: penicillin-binding protein 2, partial [Armatimonadetes bacterium]|nr:penicillin-binding protein 2 [Armatimonadota bacterium]